MQTNIALLPGTRVSIVSPTDDSDVMHVGTVRAIPRDGYVKVQIDGENLTHEWPVGQVFADE